MVRTVKALALFTVIVLLPFVVAGTLIEFGILSPFQPGTARTFLFGAITIAFTITATIVADRIYPSKPIQPFEATKELISRFLAPSEDVYPPAVSLSRSISNGFFDLIRNLAVIGALKYFADKTGNTYLDWAVQACFWVMIVWVCLDICRGEDLETTSTRFLRGGFPQERLCYFLERSDRLSMPLPKAR